MEQAKKDEGNRVLVWWRMSILAGSNGSPFTASWLLVQLVISRCNTTDGQSKGTLMTSTSITHKVALVYTDSQRIELLSDGKALARSAEWK